MRISDWSSDVCSSDLFGKHAFTHVQQALLPIPFDLFRINHVVEPLIILGILILEMARLVEPDPVSVIYSDVLRDHPDNRCDCGLTTPDKQPDRKSTRLNSSH